MSQKDPSASTGTLRVFYNGDDAHASFDNVTFLSKDAVAFVEDAGDTGVDGVLGTHSPELGTPKWRWFYTQQHGDNPTYEVQVDQP